MTSWQIAWCSTSNRDFSDDSLSAFLHSRSPLDGFAMSSSRTTPDTLPLSWARLDPEERLAFTGGRFTRVNTWCALLLAVLMSLFSYVVFYVFQHTYVAQTFLARGLIPFTIVFFASWAFAILLLKSLKLRIQQRALAIETVPSDPAFVLSPRTVDEVLGQLYRVADDPGQFLLLNRIKSALSNLKNLGRVADADEILQSLASSDESSMETSYALLQGFVWAIPVLGFIGTVQGLSQAVGGFGAVLANTAELSQIKDALREVTAGLAIAFETTMQGLVAALVIQLLMTGLKKSEEEFLDSCQEYCSRHIVGRLRLMPFEPGRES